MSEQYPTSYDMVKCSRCGAMNAAMLNHCRKCDSDLSKTAAFTVPLGVVMGIIGLILGLTLLIAASFFFELGPLVTGGLMLVALPMLLVGQLWFLFEAFQENVLWGLACIFLPFASLLFLILHSDKALKPFLISLAGGLLLLMGGIMLPALN